MLLIQAGQVRPGGRRSPGRAVAGLLSAAVVLAAVTACATSSASPAAEPAPPDLVGLRALPPISRLVHIPGPADARIEAATQRLVAGCMTAHGLAYRPPPADITPADPPSPFGLETLDLPRVTPAAEPTEDPTRGDRYGRALYGDPDRRLTAAGARLRVSLPATGCVAAAETRLLGADRVRWSQLRILLYETEQTARTALDRDPRFRAVGTAWRACVRAAGFDAADPETLARTRLRGVDVRTAPAARADVDCKRRTGYLEVGYAELAAAQTELLRRSPSLAADWTTLLNRQDRAARAVLGTG